VTLDHRKGLLLDLDGTLADSLGPLKMTYCSFLDAHGSKGTDAEFQTLNGLPLTTIIAELKARHDLADSPETLLGRYLKLVQAAQESSKPAAGASAVLEKSRSHGWRVAVVTSTPNRLAVDWIARSNLSALIDAVVGGDEVVYGKPAPDPYELAMTKLQCDAASSLAVEDSPLGAKAAVAAEIPTLALVHSGTAGSWPPNVRFISRFADIADFL
jgi:HAD superfamily hydrolase (TIGR01509 family)